MPERTDNSRVRRASKIIAVAIIPYKMLTTEALAEWYSCGSVIGQNARSLRAGRPLSTVHAITDPRTPHSAPAIRRLRSPRSRFSNRGPHGVSEWTDISDSHLDHERLVASGNRDNFLFSTTDPNRARSRRHLRLRSA